MLHQRINPRGWHSCVVAATGPSLTQCVADACRGFRVVAVNDAYRLFPSADVLYGCDARWWDLHGGCAGFPGEKWSCHGGVSHNDKTACAERWGLNLAQGRDAAGFSVDPSCIHYGDNSGFQAINLALLFGARVIVLVGFNMSAQHKRHFFGDHARPEMNNADYRKFVPAFEGAAKRLPEGVRIINATAESALTCFEIMELADALAVATESGASVGIGSRDPDAAAAAIAG